MVKKWSRVLTPFFQDRPKPSNPGISLKDFGLGPSRGVKKGVPKMAIFWVIFDPFWEVPRRGPRGPGRGPREPSLAKTGPITSRICVYLGPAWDSTGPGGSQEPWEGSWPVGARLGQYWPSQTCISVYIGW